MTTKKTNEEVETKIRVDLKLEKILEKHQTLLEVMQMPGTTITKKAEKQLSKYAKNPSSYFKDVNKMMAWDLKHRGK